MERVARAQIRYGSRLDEILGRQPALAFLQAVLKITAEGLREARSARLIQDEIQAELLTHFQSAEQAALTLAEEHAALVAGLADLVRDAVARLGSDSSASALLGFAARAKAWETRADELVTRSRVLFEQAAPVAPLAQLLIEADNVADGLEEAAHLLTLVPRDTSSTRKSVDELRGLADLITRGAQDYVQCIACGHDAHRLGGRNELEEFLVAVDAVIAFEHTCDDRERTVKATLIETCHDFRELYVLSEIAERLENAADALMRCAIALREYILNALKAR